MASNLTLYSFVELTEQKVACPDIGIYTFAEPWEVLLITSRGSFRMKLDDGYTSNCLSTPRGLRWFLPSYKDGDSRYNACGFVHDNLYEKEGYGVFDRDDCDALFRGMLRECGLNRFHASMADLALGIGAKSHWGNNEFKNLVCFSSLRELDDKGALDEG